MYVYTYYKNTDTSMSHFYTSDQRNPWGYISHVYLIPEKQLNVHQHKKFVHIEQAQHIWLNLSHYTSIMWYFERPIKLKIMLAAHNRPEPTYQVNHALNPVLELFSMHTTHSIALWHL